MVEKEVMSVGVGIDFYLNHMAGKKWKAFEDLFGHLL